MERYRSLVRLVCRPLIAVVLSACSTAAFTQQPENPQSVSIEQLLAEVQTGLARAQMKLAEGKMPLLQSVSLNLIAEARKDGGGKVNLFIVSFGQKWEKNVSQEIEIKLVPPKPLQPLAITKGPSVADQLATAIVSAAEAVQRARTHKDVPLVTSSLKVVLSFVVKENMSAGARFQIVPVTFDLSGELGNTATQKITVVYQ
jgi:hypothetical protein